MSLRTPTAASCLPVNGVNSWGTDSGNALVIGSTTSLIIAFAWAGVEHPWTSAQTLVPLLLGAAGMVSFFVWEAKFAIEPVVPWELLSNRTSAFGYASVFWHGVASTAAICKLERWVGKGLTR